MDFEQRMKAMRPAQAKIIAVAAAEDTFVLRSVVGAHAFGFATAILCGDKKHILQLADSEHLDITPFEIIDTKNALESAKVAVSLVREHKANILMKGLLQTGDLLRAVLDKESGIRGAGILSHVSILESPILKRTLLLTDAAMLISPDLKTKVELIHNAVLVAHGLGIKKPKVAPLAAIEIVNPDMPATLDAAALTMMSQRGQITDCVVDGPFALDLALSIEAAAHKGISSEVAGKADILLFHRIEAANNTLKALIYGGQCLAAGLIIGAQSPIVMTSRADSHQAKLYSIACACKVGLRA